MVLLAVLVLPPHPQLLDAASWVNSRQLQRLGRNEESQASASLGTGICWGPCPGVLQRSLLTLCPRAEHQQVLFPSRRPRALLPPEQQLPARGGRLQRADSLGWSRGTLWFRAAEQETAPLDCARGGVLKKGLLALQLERLLSERKGLSDLVYTCCPILGRTVHILCTSEEGND